MREVSTQGIDVSRLTPCGALDLAIEIAGEARERYQELAQQLEIHHTREAAAFFGGMAESEAERLADLHEQRRRCFADAPPPPPIECGVAAPDYDDVRAFMTLRQAVEAALAAEERAEAFLDSAIRDAPDASVKTLLRELREGESRLEARLRRQLAALPADREADRADLADEPVAQ